MGRSLFGNGRGSLTTLARFPMKVEEGRNVSPRGHPATTAFSVDEVRELLFMRDIKIQCRRSTPPPNLVDPGRFR